jgi:hypothetical protein
LLEGETMVAKIVILNEQPLESLIERLNHASYGGFTEVVIGSLSDEEPARVGYYNNSLVLQCDLSNYTRAQDLWVSLNPIRRVLLGGANNYFVKSNNRATDSDVLSDCWFLIEGSSTTSNLPENNQIKPEIESEVCHEIYRWLEEIGIPSESMCIAVTNESMYLLVRLIGYEINEELIRRKKQLLDFIADRFSSEKVTIERDSYKPSARIKLKNSTRITYFLPSAATDTSDLNPDSAEMGHVARQTQPIKPFDLYALSDKLLSLQHKLEIPIETATTGLEVIGIQQESQEKDIQDRGILAPAEYLERFKDVEVNTIRLSDVKAEKVDWLWYPYIALGKLILIEGDPDVGKSWLTLAIATAVSNGYGLPSSEPMEPHNVLMLSAEDGLADTIKPRLIKLGASMERIIAYNEPVTFDEKGLNKVELAIAKHGALFVSIDPLVAYIGSKVDMHRANETRPVMASLALISERQKCSITAVRHLNKNEKGSSQYRGLGSIDIMAAVRSVILVGRDNELTTRDVTISGMVHSKNNLGPKGEPIGFEISDLGFRWMAETNITVDRILNASPKEQKITKGAKAVVLLQSMLANGPRPAAEVIEKAKSEGISEETLRRACKALGVYSRKEGQPNTKNQHWVWMLPVTPEVRPI